MDVQWRQRLGALRARNAHPALRYLDAKILAEAVRARPVGAGGEAGEVAPRLTEEAQRALLQVLVQELLLAAGGEGQDAGGAAADATGALCCALACVRLSRCRSASAFSSFSSRSSGFCSPFCCEVQALWINTENFIHIFPEGNPERRANVCVGDNLLPLVPLVS